MRDTRRLHSITLSSLFCKSKHNGKVYSCSFSELEQRKVQNKTQKPQLSLRTLLLWLPSLVNFLVILGSQHPFSFNFISCQFKFFSTLRVNKVVVVLRWIKIRTKNALCTCKNLRIFHSNFGWLPNHKCTGFWIKMSVSKSYMGSRSCILGQNIPCITAV